LIISICKLFKLIIIDKNKNIFSYDLIDDFLNVEKDEIRIDDYNVNNKISDIFTPSNVRKRGFVPECTKDEIKKYFYKYVEKHGRNCFYCKEPWTYIVNDYIPNSNNKTNGGKGISRKNKIKNFSIDRIDSFKTYSISNIIFCCWACNLSKKDISIKLIKRLYEIITERNL
jgi:hypothetical protein